MISFSLATSSLSISAIESSVIFCTFSESARLSSWPISPSFSAFFKYASEGRQSGIADPKVDDLIARASAATGDERKALWSELQAYLHNEVVADVLMFHMVGFARVSEKLDWAPTMATNSMLPLAEIGFK